MTATRFTLMNPDRVTHLVLEDPLGLADYRTGIPPQSEETLYQHELHWTDPAVIRGYVAGYFVHPDPKVWEPLADVLVRVTLSPDYPRRPPAAALTFQMIYQQPVRYEYHLIAPPALLIVGAEDHVVPLGQYAQPTEAARLGDFVELSAAAAHDIPRATRVVIPDCGHIPHLENRASSSVSCCRSSPADLMSQRGTGMPVLAGSGGRRCRTGSAGAGGAGRRSTPGPPWRSADGRRC